jgi:hypothetical protein
LQVGGVEALGEAVVDVGEHRARFVATALRCEQSSETDRRAELPGLGALFARKLNCSAKRTLSPCGIGIVLLQQQLAFEPMGLSL